MLLWLILASVILSIADNAATQEVGFDQSFEERIGIAGKDFVSRQFSVKLEGKLGKGISRSETSLSYPWFVPDSLKFLQPIVDSFTLGVIANIISPDSVISKGTDVYEAYRLMDDKVMLEYHRSSLTETKYELLGSYMNLEIRLFPENISGLYVLRGRWDGSGGAHPNWSEFALVFNPVDGQRVKLSDMLDGNFKQFLDSVGQIKLDSMRNSSPFHVADKGYVAQVSTSDKYFIDSLALRFVYDWYDAGYGRSGARYDFPYSILQPFIRSDGPLGKFKK